MFSIYLVTNTVNGKLYVGQTKQLIQTRFYQHCTNKRCGILSKAIRKYGRENFTIETICECKTLEEACEVETLYISSFNSLTPNGYNICPVGSSTAGTRRRLNLTEEQMSKRRIDASRAGSSRSEKKLASARKNLQILNESGKKSIIAKGKWLTDEYREKMKKIADDRRLEWKVTTPDGENIVVVDIIKFFAEQDLGDPSVATAVAKRKRVHHKNYVFRYMDEDFGAPISKKYDNRSKGIVAKDSHGVEVMKFTKIQEAANYYGISTGSVRWSLERNKLNSKTGLFFSRPYITDMNLFASACC